MHPGTAGSYRVYGMKRLGPILVFSEVDWVFRSPSAGSLALAARILRELASEEVSVVLCSSKTRAELEQIQQELGIGQPFVCENGGALFIPRAYVDFAVPHAREIAGYQAVEFGRSYAEVVDALRRTADQTAIEIVGFSDMSVDEVARECHDNAAARKTSQVARIRRALPDRRSESESACAPAQSAQRHAAAMLQT